MAVDGAGLYPLFTTQFSTNLELLLQQKGSMLRGRVRTGTHTGKMASPVNQIGTVQLKAPAGRYAPMPRVDADFTRRWVFPQDGELPQLIDSFDELKTIVDPKSEYNMNAANAVGRAWDDCIINAATATAYTGQDAAGLSSETFDTSKFQIASTFGSSAASGLTVAKIIEAKRIFRKYHNDLDSDQITLVAGSQQESDLLNQVQVVSTDFNDRPVLVDGKVTRFLGMDIVYSERLTWASNVRTCLVWVKSGMYLGMWKDMTNRISIRNDLSSEPFQLYTSTSYGATRLQPGKVLTILCADTTGADITP
jgi:hypothetical protein